MVFPARGLLFDLDGTLVDSVPDIAAAVNQTLEELGVPARPESAVRRWIGNGAGQTLKRALTNSVDGEPDTATFEQAMPRFLDWYAAYNGQHTTLYPGVVATLEQFQSQGFAMACVTNKPERHTGALLAHLDLSRFFGSVVAGDSLKTRKPDPEPLLHAASALGVEPERCIMIGDSLSDVRSGKAAGMPMLCLTYGYHQGADLGAAGADMLIDEFTALVDLVEFDGR